MSRFDLQAGGRAALGFSQTQLKSPLGSNSNLSLQPHLLREFICLVKKRNKKTNDSIQEIKRVACSAVPQAVERIRISIYIFKLSPQTLILHSKAIHSQLLGIQQSQETSQHIAHPPRSKEHFAFAYHTGFYQRLHKALANTYQIQFSHSSREMGQIICKFTNELSKVPQSSSSSAGIQP